MLKTQVAIKMTMEILDAGKQDVTIVEEKGQLLEKANTTVLKFSEENENKERTDSLITIHSDRVSVKRSGAVSMLQKFDEKRITENVYRHQFGTIHMQTETEQVTYQPPQANEDGKLFISYSTSLNNDKPRRHLLTILVKKEE
ncbi:DUF1934 domain-containing protein [Gracilibacillus kekensis]|uniref:Uncharacterized beta-barrel protein YwiB, DUF1934 family n=1 Tax=Gracilibacillus kekensis TaxID=1027249 RepID=A0A1M7KD20_9BACI|nr:DUF1934 domain-containing protein [Gracilibacillus kekensis]SHM63167.1 Uncharacterized beta-barrel protein YwiB, DUF1934 family [Gracilibacillus kekensis]